MPMDVGEQYDKIYRYCYFKLHNRELAEDVTQEAFLRYFENYRFESEDRALRCLYVIARNLCVDQFRRPQAASLEEPEGRASPGENPLREESKEEQIITGIQVRAALARLGQEEQELLLLRYVNGVSAAVIGRILGISRYAAHRRLAAASKKFREAYGRPD